jgi:hypothetical protein
MNRHLFNAKFAVRRIFRTYPRAYFLMTQLRNHPSTDFLSGTEAISPETEILITGLARSGNSFAVNAFRIAQGRPVHIAHHVYPPPQLFGAARRNIPAIMLVRPPDEVSVSRVVSHPPITLRQALVDYAQCYQAVLPLREHFVIGNFSVVTSDLGSVIREVNQRFGTTFREFEHTEDNVALAFEKIDERYRAMGSMEQKAFGRMVARPSKERQIAKETVREQLELPALQRLRAQAQLAYDRLVN